MQIKWLVSTFSKQILTEQEVAPYIRILLMDDDVERIEYLREGLNTLDSDILEKMLSSADIYDVPKLFGLMKSPEVRHAVIALKKTPPPYEKRPFFILDKVFHAIHNNSKKLLKEAAEALRMSGGAPEHFEETYARFQEIVQDEQILSTLFPKAKG